MRSNRLRAPLSRNRPAGLDLRAWLTNMNNIYAYYIGQPIKVLALMKVLQTCMHGFFRSFQVYGDLARSAARVPRRRSDEHEVAEQVPARDGRNASDHAGHGVPHERRPPHPQLVHERHELIRQLVVRGAVPLATATTGSGAGEAPVEDDDAEPRRQRRHDVVPDEPGAAVPVRQHHRLPVVLAQHPRVHLLPSDSRKLS